jgi:S1-C subfamily serine protease
VRKLIATLMILGLLGIAAPAAAVLPSQVTNQLYSSAVVRNLGSGSICGGTFLKVDVVITASHCVIGAKNIIVYDVQGSKYQVVGVVVRETRDLALLKLDQASPIARPAPIGDAGIGTEVWVIGAPAGAPFLVLHGYVAGIAHQQLFDGKPYTDKCTGKDMPANPLGTTYQQYLTLDARVYYGDSGGGVFDGAGYLIGVTVALQSVGNCEVQYVLWGFAIGPEAIQEFLNEVGG